MMGIRDGWELKKIGAGSPPVKTDEGWLLLYHAVDEKNIYRAGAALFDIDEPWKIIARTSDPILEPEDEYERIGDVPDVVFPEGNFVIDDELIVIYGAVDKYCCTAKIDLSELIDYLLDNRCKL